MRKFLTNSTIPFVIKFHFDDTSERFQNVSGMNHYTNKSPLTPLKC